MSKTQKDWMRAASNALALGELDARHGIALRTATEVRDRVVTVTPDWRIFHTKKLRQVYGAAYDATRAYLNLPQNK